MLTVCWQSFQAKRVLSSEFASCGSDQRLVRALAILTGKRGLTSNCLIVWCPEILHFGVDLSARGVPNSHCFV
jgi:hypothetical protein